MGIIIATAIQKGGVGKTTVCINVAAELATRGSRVLVIDLDHQTNATTILSGGRYHFATPTTADLFRTHPPAVQACILPVQLGEGLSADNFDFIPAQDTLDNVLTAALTRHHRERILGRLLDQVRDSYDYILLDCPLSLSSLATVNALACSDFFLVPVDTGTFALDGLSDLLSHIRALKEIPEGGDLPYAVVRNKHALASTKTHRFLDEELAAVGKHLMNTTIGRRDVVDHALMARQPVRYYAPNHAVTAQFKALTEELLANYLGAGYDH
jgi:chromosome partitioning protein